MTKTALITGANRGIGLEFSKQLLENGYQVIACCRTPESADDLSALLKQHSTTMEIYPLDVADEDAVAKLGQQLAKRPIDLLINNAGIYGGSDQVFGKTDTKAWAEVLKTNTIAPMKVAEAFYPSLQQGQDKKIAFITSKMGSMADNTSGHCYLYRSSKAGLNAVIKSLSVDLADESISVVALHPGWVQTDMGGPNALISVEDSVKGMCQQIEQLTPKQTGQFLAYDGAVVPW